MAKRFTDTEKWKKPFIRSLPIEYKCFWFYILDDCDHAGIWHIDIEVAQIKLGIKLSLEKARGFFAERVVEFDGGNKWFVPDFIQFQYGVLSEKNRLHGSVLLLLKKYSLMGHISPLQGAKDKDKDKDKDKEEGGLGETKFSIEHCLQVALSDSRWTRANKAEEFEISNFNQYLEKQGIYKMNPNDYKRYFAKLKGKYPKLVSKREFTMEELRLLAEEMDKKIA